MPAMPVVGVTVSLKVGDVDYGRGSERFVSLRSETPEGEAGIEANDFDAVLDQVLGLSLQAWESIQASRYAGGVIKSDELRELIHVGQRRTERVTHFLKQRGHDAGNPEQTEG